MIITGIFQVVPLLYLAGAEDHEDRVGDEVNRRGEEEDDLPLALVVFLGHHDLHQQRRE